MVNQQKLSGSCEEPWLWRGAIIEVLHCDGEVAQDIEEKKRLRENRGSSGPAMQNRPRGMLSGLSLRDGSAHFITFKAPPRSNQMEDKSAKISIRWISECTRESLMRVL